VTKCKCSQPLSGIPLGGIGTGSVEIRADGGLHEWLIFNNPPWSGQSEFLAMDTDQPLLKPQDSLFAVRIKGQGAPVVRALRSAIGGSEIEWTYVNPYLRSAEVRYQARFPTADLTYSDPALPVALTLHAWSPFIPGDVKHSALPAACFTFTVENTGDEEIEVSLLGLFANPLGMVQGARPHNSIAASPERTTLRFAAEDVPDADPMARGDMALTVLGGGASYDAYAIGGGFGWGGAMAFWDGFRDSGRLPDRAEPPVPHPMEMAMGGLVAGTVTSAELYAGLPASARGFLEAGLVRDPREFERRVAADPIRLKEDVGRRWNLILELSLAGEARGKFQAALAADATLADDPVRLGQQLESLSTVNVRQSIPARSLTPRGALCRTIRVAAGACEQIAFLLTWYFPNHRALGGSDDMGHAYENWFAGAGEVADYVAERLDDLRERTERFLETLYGGALPYWLADAINAQLTTFVKSSFYVRDGRFGLWEGLGCCGLQTLDVSYYGSFPILLLFPELEKRQMRMTADFQLTRESPRYEEYFLAFPRNKAAFQKRLAADPALATDRARRFAVYQEIIVETGYDAVGRLPHFFPGSFATVDAYHMIDLMPKFALLVYRDYLWSGDEEYLKTLWPHVQMAIDHNVGQDEQGVGLPYHYGHEATDIPISSQTYDAWDFLGYSAYVCSIWLAALRATEVMARRLGDAGYAAKMAALFERCQVRMEELLWNGEYYDLWNDPPRDKRNEFCMADQLAGEWYVNALALPEILPVERVRSALAAINRNNRLPERGLVNGALPEGKQAFWEEGMFGAPRNLQSDTPWSGTEYAVAALFIQEGMVEEGLAVVKDVYDRYQQAGLTWNHIECGGHYYRAMSVWTVLQALQGLLWDAPAARLTLAPVLAPQEHRSLLALPSGWGVFAQEGATTKGAKKAKGAKQTVELCWESGTLTLRELRLGLLAGVAGRLAGATLDGQKIEAQASVESGQAVIAFAAPVTLAAGQVLRTELK
jgi:uncharacterized protein (DUF608 family)